MFAIVLLAVMLDGTPVVDKGGPFPSLSSCKETLSDVKDQLPVDKMQYLWIDCVELKATKSS